MNLDPDDMSTLAPAHDMTLVNLSPDGVKSVTRCSLDARLSSSVEALSRAVD